MSDYAEPRPSSGPPPTHQRKVSYWTPMIEAMAERPGEWFQADCPTKSPGHATNIEKMVFRRYGMIAQVTRRGQTIYARIKPEEELHG